MKYLIEPWKHQLEAIERAKALPGFAFFFEMGTGKTGTTINTLRHRFNEEKRHLRTIIFCPPIVVPNWKDEWKKHSTIPSDRVILLQGPGKKRLQTFLKYGYEEKLGEKIPRGCVFVTNYEALLMKDLYQAMIEWRPEALVFDESHKLKSPTAQRSKLAEALANPHRRGRAKGMERPCFKHDKPLTYLLSGSPVLNTPMDIFQQFLILDGGQTFGTNFFMFRARYFRDKNAGMPRDRHFPDWQVLPGAIEEINRLIFTKGMRVMKSECLDLPPLVQQTIKVPMAPEQKRLYEEMKRDFIAVLGDKACTATLAITKAQRLMQIASGYIKVVDGDEITIDDTPKMEALEELLEQLTPSHKVIVWAVWRKNYAEIKKVCDKLGLGYAEVYGGIGANNRDAAVKRFQTDPACRVFIGNPGAGGIGINLVQAPYAIFYSRNFSLEESLQAEARNHRGGSEIHDKITRIDLVCEDSIDEIVQRKLAEKIDMSEKVLQDIRAEMLLSE